MTRPASPLPAARGWPASGVAVLSTAVMLGAVVLFCLAQLRPPAALPAEAPADQFAAGRALAHVRALSQAPHPIGSPAHAAARDYIVDQLISLGVEHELQQVVSANPAGQPPYRAATVRNIVARLPGRAPGPAILLAAHYDSVTAGPGANDDAVGVATLLEALRAARAGPPLQHDLIVLFTDCEESGMLGARAFVSQHAWARQVGLVLNFEARGSAGPSLMFEVSPNNGRLIEEFAGAAPAPFASSLFYDVYKYLPNDTDFTIFKNAGMPGFNFAYIGGFTAYHSPLDSFERTSAASLQHHGGYALALLRHFANRDQAAGPAEDVVFFDLFGLLLVRYSLGMARALLALLALAFIGLLAWAWRRRQIRLGGLALGALALIPQLAVAALLALALQPLLANRHQEYSYYGDTFNHGWYAAGLTLLVLAGSAALQLWFGRRLAPASLALGALLWWLVLAALTTIALPGGSYLFSWPLLGALAGQALALAAPATATTRRWLAPLLGALPALVLFTPLIALLFTALTLRLALVPALVAALLLGLLAPQLAVLAAGRRWLLPAAAGLAGLAALLGGVLAAGPSPDQPRFNNVLYGLNADTNQATWAMFGPRGDAWTSQFIGADSTIGALPDFFPLTPLQIARAAAPGLPLAAPTASVLADSTAGAVRTLRLRISSARQATLIWVYAGAQTRVLSASVGGAPLGAAAPWGLAYWAPPPEGIELTLQVDAGQPAQLRLIDWTSGLPDLPGRTITPRTADMQPSPAMGLVQFSNATLVSKSFTF